MSYPSMGPSNPYQTMPPSAGGAPPGSQQAWLSHEFTGAGSHAYGTMGPSDPYATRSQLGPPTPPPGVHPGAAPPPPKAAGQELTIKEVVALAFGAWLLFSGSCVLFGLSYHNSRTLLWLLLAIGVVAFSGISFQSWRLRRVVPGVAGMWFLFAMLLGASVGYHVYDCCIQWYWRSRTLDARANVVPSESAAAYANVGEIVFADEATIDPSRAVGYKDKHTYCVAPILGDAPPEKVQFWAAGLDCCGSRGSFYCDDAWNPKAKSGLVIHKVIFGEMADYHKAVKMAEVTYEMASAEDPIFVKWVANPDQVELNIWRAGLGVLIAALCSTLLLCCLQGACIYMAFRNVSPYSRAAGGPPTGKPVAYPPGGYPPGGPPPPPPQHQQSTSWFSSELFGRHHH